MYRPSSVRTALAAAAAAFALAALPGVAGAGDEPTPATGPVAASQWNRCPQLRVAQGTLIGGRRGRALIRVQFNAGLYNLRTLGKLRCANAEALFSDWLRRGAMNEGGRLEPVADSKTSRFIPFWPRTNVTFDVTPVAEPQPTPGLKGALCPGRLQVARNGKAGPVRVSKGAYSIALLSKDIAKTGLDCQAAAGNLAGFLKRSKLPSPWTASSSRDTFYRGSYAVGFQIHRIGGARRTCPPSQSPKAGAIAGVGFPAGSYAISSDVWSCDQVTGVFQQFLADGKVSRPWTVKLRPGTQVRRFYQPAAMFGFDAKLIS